MQEENCIATVTRVSKTMNTEYDVDLISAFYILMKQFFYHYTAYREIIGNLDKLLGGREFWVYTCDAHLYSAIIT